MGITQKCLSFLPWRTLHISGIFSFFHDAVGCFDSFGARIFWLTVLGGLIFKIPN